MRQLKQIIRGFEVSIGLFCLAACAPPTESPGNAAPAARPNILFVYSDDHAYQAVSAYGFGINDTPNLDRLATEGMLFEECYVTNSICGPMRAVVQTGKYSHRNGYFYNYQRFDGSQQTFPKLLREAGYQTAIIGKWHLITPPQGYDYSEVLIEQGPYYNPPMIRNGTKVEHEGYTTDIITDLTLEWLATKRDPAKPFMLMYQHKAPHRSWQPGPRHLNLFDGQTIPEPHSLFDDHSGLTQAAKTSDMSIEKTLTPYDLKFVPPKNLTAEQLDTWKAAYDPKNEAFRKQNLEGEDLIRWKYQRYVKDYLRCVASIDENLGRVLDYLDESGLAQNTIVVYTSDQGFYLGEHGWFDKRWIYEQSLRTPLLIRWPKVIAPGSVNRDIVSPLDFAETFLDVAEAPIPDDMQGSSLVPLLEGRSSADWRKSLYYQYFEYPAVHSVRRHYGVVDGRYKLIRFYEPDVDEWELIDLDADPGELRSFYDDPAYEKVQARLKEELAEHRRNLGVPEQDPPETYPQKMRDWLEKNDRDYRYPSW